MMRSKLRIAALGGVVALVLSLSRPAGADCPTGAGSWSAGIPVRISPEDHPRHQSDATRYANNTTHTWSLHSHRAVVRARASITTWNTETCCDWLQVNGTGFEHKYRGNLATGYNSPDWLPFTNDGGLNGKFFRLWWRTDGSVNVANVPLIGQTQVRCASGVLNTAQGPLLPGKKYDGILHTSGASPVYFWFPQPAGQRLFVYLRGLAGSGGADFDLYGDPSNAFPHTGSTWSSTSLTMNEAIEIPSVGTARNVYFGVHSYSGTGHFQFQVYAKPWIDITNARKVCSQDVIPTGAPWNTFVDSLKQASLRLASATQGSRMVEAWNVVKIPPCSGSTETKQFSLCDSSCDVSVTPVGLDDCGPLAIGYQALTGNLYRIPSINCFTYSDPWAAMTNIHEMGHGHWNLPDEYNPTPFCGHGLMNGPVTHVFCVGLNHCRDPSAGSSIPPGFDCTATGSMWNRILGDGDVWPSSPGSQSPNPSFVHPITAAKDFFITVTRDD